MASGRPELRAWRTKNDIDNRRGSITSIEDVPVSGADVPFEELLARELRKSAGNGSKLVAVTGNKTSKKSFLKKGARGWWMRRPDARKKAVKHTLASNDEVERKRMAVMQRRPQQREGRSLSVSLSNPHSPAREQVRANVHASQTLSPSVSPMRWTHCSYQDGDKVQQLKVQKDSFAAWKNASLHSTTSTDIMGMQNVRQSYEATQEREANDMAEFEAIERDLAAEKEAFLMEKQQTQQDRPVQQREQIHRDDLSGAYHWELPYSSFVSDLQDQEKSRRQTTRRDSTFDGSLDGEVDSALELDDYSALSKDDGMSEQDGSTCQLRDHFGYGNCYGDPPSNLSDDSCGNSVSWDDGSSLQPRLSAAHEQSINSAASGLLVSPKKQDCLTGLGVRRQTTKSEVCFAKHDGDGTHALGHNKSGIPDFIRKANAPVSLVRHVFGEFEQDENSTSYEDDTSSIGDSISINTAWKDLSPPSPPPFHNRLSSDVKQKLRVEQKSPVTRTPMSKVKNDGKQTRQAKAKTAASPRVSGNQKSGSSNNKLTHSRDQPAQLVDSRTLLPAIIEEKLYELEAEVKFFKSETLQLQKRKSYYDQELKKLALDRDEFERFQQEQRLLLERERTKMKKELQFQERQCKLRMNATTSHQDRKDLGELEMLKAQIKKMQVDEKAGASKWKAENDNLRQRVLELEERNRELTDEVKLLEKDHLEQWEQYERLGKKAQATTGLASKAGVTSSVPSVLCKKNELGIMNDVFAINGTADELLKRWSYPHKSSLNTHDENDTTANSAYQNCVQPNLGDSYNLKRYRFDREESHALSEPETLTGGNELNRPSVKDMDITSNTDHALASNAAATGRPTAEDAEILPNSGYADQKSNNREEDGAISVPSSSLSEYKVVAQVIEHTGGKKELLHTDGSRKIIFPDGNEKDIDANGNIVIKFTNGDHKEVFPDTGVNVYYYHEAQTKLTTYPDNRKVYEFPNQQIETSLPDGTTEIQFPDGTKKTIRPNGDEFSVFPDGTTLLEELSGLREVTLLNQKHIRSYPDGRMACVSFGGQETRIRSDSELKQLMKSM